ncbi:MAG: hypothetical protein AAFX76_01515 [Planctomycetota bacterium]
MFDDFPREFWPAMQYVLWRYEAQDGLAIGYHWLNLAEAVAWFVVAAVVARRLVRRHRRPGWEAVYVGLFVLFGLSDVFEAYRVPVWLVAAKGLNFAAIVAVRRFIVRRVYAGSRF